MTGPCCAHMKVFWTEQHQANGSVRGWWQCGDCWARFAPASDADKLRTFLSTLCDEASTALDKATPGNDQNYWGARLRLAQELAHKIDAGDFRL